jgi:hypothetical protein
MEITIDDHPARQIIHGESVPLIDDVKLIRINGIGAGYCGVEPGRPVTMVRPYPKSVMEEVRVAVEAYTGGSASSLNQPPDLSSLEEADYGDDDNEGDEP